MTLYSVIKNQSPLPCLLWKHPGEDFNNNSQLTVSESEVALFYKEGVIVQEYTGGRYTLNTNNVPFIRRIISKFSGGVSAFNCAVYFISKTHAMDVKWGTQSPIPMRDAQYGFAVGVRARGSYTVQVKDAKKFLLKMLGTNMTTYSVEELNSCFRTAFQQKIKVEVATVMKNLKMTILDMATEYENIANKLHPVINGLLDEYGLRCVNFYVSDISIPQDDPNYQKINEAYARVGSRNIEGITWQQDTQANILRDMANNQGFGGMGAGMGMGFAAGNIFGSMANGAFSQQAPQQQGAKCPSCGTDNAKTAKFCSNCGKPLAAVCPNCGASLTSGVKFCSNCGFKV